MTPESVIADLDAALLRVGQKVTLRRYSGTGGSRINTDLPDVMAVVRAVSAEDLVGDIKQMSSKLILSPTDITTFWPLKTSDKVLIDGVEREIMAVKPFKVANTLVRCELVVSG